MTKRVLTTTVKRNWWLPLDHPVAMPVCYLSVTLKGEFHLPQLSFSLHKCPRKELIWILLLERQESSFPFRWTLSICRGQVSSLGKNYGLTDILLTLSLLLVVTVTKVRRANSPTVNTGIQGVQAQFSWFPYLILSRSLQHRYELRQPEPRQGRRLEISSPL